MGALICSKISAKKALLVIVVTALVFLYAFIFPGFGRIVQQDGLQATNATGVIRRSGPILSPEEISHLLKTGTKYFNRRLLLSGMETRHELKGTTQSLAANIRDLVTRRVGRSVVLSTGSRRFLANNKCSNKDISIIQSEEPNTGIPRYVVQIVNTCISDCAPTDIHVFCGWFASTPLVNPNYFKRIAYNDCLVNGGRPLTPGNICTDKDISITQSRDGTTGIPLYSVQITNTCMSDCAPSDIHVNCGWFASSPPPNPKVFTRLAYNDCLVNGGKPLLPGNIIQFQYANSFMYPLTFKSAEFCRT